MDHISLNSERKDKGKGTDDALFLERLEIVYKKCLTDLQSFAEREHCPFDDVRRCPWLRWVA